MFFTILALGMRHKFIKGLDFITSSTRGDCRKVETFIPLSAYHVNNNASLLEAHVLLNNLRELDEKVDIKSRDEI